MILSKKLYYKYTTSCFLFF